jgi:hypothetical protein
MLHPARQMNGRLMKSSFRQIFHGLPNSPRNKRLFKGALGFADVMQEIQRDIARNLWDFFEAVRLYPPAGWYGAAGRILCFE